MPVCSIDTNLKRSQVPADFNKDLASLIATVLKKSPEVTVGVDNVFSRVLNVVIQYYNSCFVLGLVHSGFTKNATLECQINV